MLNIKRFHPGVYLKDALESINMKANEFAARTGISERTLSGIINEDTAISFEVAYKLANFFDTSINYWTNLQNDYELYQREKVEKESLDFDFNLIKPIKSYLIENEYAKAEDGKEEMVKKIRSLVGVNYLSLLSSNDSFACFKKQKSDKNDNAFLENFWIALALNKARKKEIKDFDIELLKSSIPSIKALNLLEPQEFYPKLTNILEECGVSFVLLPYLPKSNIYGVTKWFNKNNVMIAVSNRGEKPDLFWFTIFHELAHVLMQHKREMLYYVANKEDEEADRLASEILIKEKSWKYYINSIDRFSEKNIREFASEEKVIPEIVLGRLHKEKLLPYNMFSKIFNKKYDKKDMPFS